jgi:hypothetical protein
MAHLDFNRQRFLEALVVRQIRRLDEHRAVHRQATAIGGEMPDFARLEIQCLQFGDFRRIGGVIAQADFAGEMLPVFFIENNRQCLIVFLPAFIGKQELLRQIAGEYPR